MDINQIELKHGYSAYRVNISDLKRPTLDRLIDDTLQLLDQQQTDLCKMLIIDLCSINTVMTPYAKHIICDLLETWHTSHDGSTAIITDSTLLSASLKAFFHFNLSTAVAPQVSIFSGVNSALSWLNLQVMPPLGDSNRPL